MNGLQTASLHGTGGERPLNHDAEWGGDVMMRQELDAREYKLLLCPAKFNAPLSEASANAFWHRQIEQIIRKSFNSSDAVQNAFDE
ncbi:hypothetical protein [Sinorhizobium meliloti]|uniref:hypothetical protein n=1 Tax=Rhizobium meliloti TaxID=382 RepID=UPI00238017A1|nr:hypothetical protein [Sinorhizobium meliloti]MDE3819722.1 hypothetical protein [Sinorhizobium meliloti]